MYELYIYKIAQFLSGFHGISFPRFIEEFLLHIAKGHN